MAETNVALARVQIARYGGADGFEYERRNRMTLCRCGGSRNKPFCDGTHLSIGFSSER